MLINSLLIFIEETLPIFVLYAYLCAWHTFFEGRKETNTVQTNDVNSFSGQVLKLKQDHHVYFICAILLGLLLSVFITRVRPWLGMTLDGIGYEALLIVLAICSVVSVLLGQMTNNSTKRKGLFSLSLFLLVLPHASDFMVFFKSVVQVQLYASVYVGVSIGLGICLSISYLLFFVFLNVGTSLPLKVAIAIFLGGQLSNIVNILQQIDVLSSSLPLWNTNGFIADSNEYGQFFHVLVGYDATPTLIYLVILGASTLVIFTLLMRSKLIESKSTLFGVVQ